MGSMDRRGFLRVSGLALGATVLTGAGLTSSCSGELDPIEVDWIETTYGGEGVGNKKVLVTYASYSGSTVGVADAIGKKISETGVAVDVLPLKNGVDLTGYDAVVVGSAIQSGEWLPEAVKFVQDHKKELGAVPTAFFLVCLMTTKSDEQSQKFVGEFLTNVRSAVTPVAEGRFTGAYLPDKYSLATRIGMKFFAGYLKIKPGDYRNRDAINAWAESTAPLLISKN